MKNRPLLVLVFGLVAALFSPLGAAEKDPFVEKFGGPYNEGVSAEFRKNLVEYVGGLKGAFGSLGVDGLKSQEGFEDFCKDFIDPALAKLVPKTDGEKKLKEAALQVKAAFAFAADSESLPEEKRKEIAGFLKASPLPGEPQDEGSQFTGMLIRFSSYSLGMDSTEYMRLLKKRKDAEE